MPIRFTKDLILSGLDMRSSRGRRYKATVAAVIAEFGLIHPRLLRELAGMRFILDEAQGAAISGDIHAREDWLKISDLVARREAQMRETIRTPEPAHAA